MYDENGRWLPIGYYECCICHKELERFDVIRLVKQTYGDKRRFNNTGDNYDFCKNCFTTFDRWWNKHNGEQTRK